MPAIALHPGHHRARHRARHRQVDLVVAAVQHLVGVCQRRLAVSTGGWLHGDRFVRRAGQRAATALATQAPFAWSGRLGLLRLVWLLTLGRRQAGVVRGLSGLTQRRFKIRDPCRQALHLRPQRPDQGVFFGVAQVVEVGKLGHAPG